MLTSNSVIKCWKIISNKKNSSYCRISCSEKNDLGTYDNVFSGCVYLFGCELIKGGLYKVNSICLNSEPGINF